jgi:hypothetical protein
MKSWTGGAWSFVHLGCIGAPANSCGNGAAQTNISVTPVIAEKPYIVEANGKYTLVVPKYETNKAGYSWTGTGEDEISFENVYVASENDSAATINSKLQKYDHVVLQPGNYNLSESIKITKDR